MAKTKCSDYHELFHRNMLALTTFNETTRYFQNCFKIGMFTRSNLEGFFQVAHFLMNIIYPRTTVFRDCFPILCKSQEREFRAAVNNLIRGLNDEFGDIFQMSYVVPSRLMSPGGDIFVRIMWELSMLAMAVQAFRDSEYSSEITILHRPPATTPLHLRGIAAKIMEAVSQADYQEGEVDLDQFIKKKKLYKESKERSLDRMLMRENKIKHMISSTMKLLKESDLGDALVLKLMAPNNEEGMRELDKNLEEKSKHVDEILQHWADIASLSSDTKATLEAAILQENDSQRPILDASSLYGCDTTSDSLTYFKMANTGICNTSLLEYVSGQHDRLNAIRPVKEKSNLSGCLDKWKSISKEREELDAELKKMESELEKKSMELSSLEQNISTEGESVNESHDNLSVTEGADGWTSTPIHDLSMKSRLNFTPYQLPRSKDYFHVKLEEMQREFSDEKSKIIQPMNISSKAKDNSFDDLLERFRKIVVSRQQKSENN